MQYDSRCIEDMPANRETIFLHMKIHRNLIDNIFKSYNGCDVLPYVIHHAIEY